MTDGSQIRIDDGRMLGYSEYGDPEGWPLFYFHGFPGSRLDWLMFDGPATVDSGARVIALDRPGYGASDPAPGRKLIDWAQDVAASADALGLDRFSVLGVSGGGPYALACAAAIPERLSSVGVVSGMGPADALGMKDGSSWTIPGKPGLLRKPLLSLMEMGVRKDPGQFVERSAGSFAAVDGELLDDPEVAEAYTEMLREALRQGTKGAAIEAALLARPWGFSLGSTQVPVHLWHGDLDENVPISVGRHVASQIPDCTATFLEGEGHLTLPRTHLGTILGQLKARA